MSGVPGWPSNHQRDGAADVRLTQTGGCRYEGAQPHRRHLRLEEDGVPRRHRRHLPQHSFPPLRGCRAGRRGRRGRGAGRACRQALLARDARAASSACLPAPNIPRQQARSEAACTHRARPQKGLCQARATLSGTNMWRPPVRPRCHSGSLPDGAPALCRAVLRCASPSRSTLCSTSASARRSACLGSSRSVPLRRGAHACSTVRPLARLAHPRAERWPDFLQNSSRAEKRRRQSRSPGVEASACLDRRSRARHTQLPARRVSPRPSASSRRHPGCNRLDRSRLCAHTPCTACTAWTRPAPHKPPRPAEPTVAAGVRCQRGIPS